MVVSHAAKKSRVHNFNRTHTWNQPLLLILLRETSCNKRKPLVLLAQAAHIFDAYKHLLHSFGFAIIIIS